MELQPQVHQRKALDVYPQKSEDICILIFRERSIINHATWAFQTMHKLWRSRGATAKEYPSLTSSKRGAQKTNESEGRETIANSAPVTDPKRSREPNLGITILHEPSTPAAAVVE